jgi:hypothetical protein
MGNRRRDYQGETIMALGKHEHTKHGASEGTRRFAGKNLRQDYSEFDKVDARTKLETLRERYNVDSLNKVREKLRGSR